MLHRIVQSGGELYQQLGGLVYSIVAKLGHADCNFERSTFQLLLDIFARSAAVSNLVSSETAWRHPVAILNVLEQALSNSVRST